MYWVRSTFSLQIMDGLLSFLDDDGVMVSSLNNVYVSLFDLLGIHGTFTDYYLDALRCSLHLFNYSDYYFRNTCSQLGRLIRL